MNPIATDNPPLTLGQKLMIGAIIGALTVLGYHLLTGHYVKQNIALGRYPLQRKGS